ncbi:MAG TPA: hypothetical protein VLC79_15295 [Cellvibrio sp.]|nr:hypothetical protein [Cellvibrio sp.]
MTTDAVCKNCCSSINREAKICPFCLTPQSVTASLKRFLPALMVFVVIFIALKFLSGPGRPDFKPPVPFSAHKNELLIESSELSFSECGECKSTFNTVTIGMIKNNTPYGWEDFKLEVRFYNAEGKLIDSVSETSYGLAVQPNSEVSFRVMERAAKATAEYVTHKVIINDAQQISDYY